MSSTNPSILLQLLPVRAHAWHTVQLPLPHSALRHARPLHLLARQQRSVLPPAPAAAGPSRRRRTFASTSAHRATIAQRPQGHQTVLLSYPSPAALHEDGAEDVDEAEVDYVPPEEATLQITDRAAEQLRTVAARESNADAALRIAVESGGCHGYQYKMELAKSREPDDYVFTHPTIRPSNIIVDAVSIALLKGSTIDFATELIGSSFRVVENPQAKGGSCGCGVSWELKI